MAADFTAWLEASPMLNDVEHFRSYPSADTTHRRDRSALDTFRNLLGSTPAPAPPA